MLSTSSEPLTGLTDTEVQRSRADHGQNRLPAARRHTLHVFVGVLMEPMLLLLLVACTLYFLTSQFEEGFIMLFAISMVAGISIFQEVRSEKAIEALRQLLRPYARVIRAGAEIALPVEDIVVGDLLQFSEGELVAADAALVQFNDFSVDESVLTGESLPVYKREVGAKIFAATTVVSGSGIARVTAVGSATQVGQLGLSLRQVKEGKTQLQRQIAHFVKYMALVGLLAFLLVWGYHWMETRDWLHSLFHGLTLAMAIIPEEIPVAVSTFLALGAYRMIRKNVLARHPQTVEALGAATVICVDKTGTITQNRMSVAAIYLVADDLLLDSFDGLLSVAEVDFLRTTRLACEPIVFDAMERAVEELCTNKGIDVTGSTMVYEYPLSGRYPMMTHVYATESGSLAVVVKGAPEGVVMASTCTAVEKSALQQRVAALASKGYRVLAVGETTVPSKADLPASQESFKFHLKGLIAFSDPIKENIPEVVRAFHAAGIDVKMITGDFPETACRIAAAAGFASPEKYLTGEQLTSMSDTELSDAVRRIDVFARAMPDTKLKLIEVLKRNGEVVAMTGDGVNDAPALKAANIGVAMGKRGSEVARQASSLVLLNDDLSGMIDAVAMGRKIYANLKKAIQYIISIHVPILMVVVLPLIVGWSYINIFTPIHVIFLELIMGPTCSIVFENEPVEAEIMNRRPRQFSVAFFNWRELAMSLFQGFVIAAGLMVVIFFGMKNSLGEPMTRTLVFSTLIFANILLTLTGRSRFFNLLTTIRYSNHLMPVMLTLTLLLWAITIGVAEVRVIFGFELPQVLHVLGCLLIAMSSVLWIEFFKRKRAR